MFNNLFGKKETPKEEISLHGEEVAVEEKPKVKNGYDPIILEIHKEFETSADNLLKQALEIVNDIKEPTEKEKLLLKHGFSLSKEAVKQREIRDKEEFTKNQIATINYYKQNYPFNKFIFLDQVEAICKKYNLVFGKASDYKGFVPEKNLKEIDNFKLKEEDHKYVIKSINSNYCKEITREEYERHLKSDKGLWLATSLYYSKEKELSICAPIHDMNTSNKRIVDGYKLEDIPLDPVVLHPVRGGGFLVLTAWGDEASDPIIQNEILN